MSSRSRPTLMAIIGPGLLVAATGIGAGDLATASFTGSILGTAVLWAAVVGAFLKFVVTEGLARWKISMVDCSSAASSPRAVTGLGSVVRPIR